jgi:thiosulfate/3-mercaptopyruvate sulfurtransferase
MQYTTLIDANDAVAHLQDPNWIFVDCRAVLGAPEKARQAYRERHIPGAVFADLETDLSGRIESGRTGRHPLPIPADFDATLSRLGVDPRMQVVAYDQRSGAMAAARLWWLLRWAGHDSVAVLDGGFDQWLALGLPTSSGNETRAAASFTGHYQPEMQVDADEVLASLESGNYTLADSRTSDRYRGENETIDPIAGHIPGAVSLPYTDNLGQDSLFIEPGRLRERFDGLAHTAGAASTIFYCGSGVTAAHNVLAFAHAGLGMPKLYAGSWSEWITDPARPVATGEE